MGADWAMYRPAGLRAVPESCRDGEDLGRMPDNAWGGRQRGASQQACDVLAGPLPVRHRPSCEFPARKLRRSFNVVCLSNSMCKITIQ